MSFLLALGIGAMGGLGALLRYVIDSQLKRVYKASFPLTTLLINALACFLAGWFAALAVHGTIDGSLRLLLATGFCGGLSTFSSAANEVVALFDKDKYGAATGYLACCVFVPILFVILGYSL